MRLDYGKFCDSLDLLWYIVKEYEDEIPFDGNGVINPRKSLNDGEDIHFDGTKRNGPRDGRIDDEDSSDDGSGMTVTGNSPDDPR